MSIKSNGSSIPVGSSYLHLAQQFERSHLSMDELKKLKDQLGSLPKEDKNLFFASLYKTLSPFPKGKDYFRCAEDAFYGKNKQTSTPRANCSDYPQMFQRPHWFR